MFKIITFLQECSYDKLSSIRSKDSWLMNITDLNYFKGSSTGDIPMMCQVVTGLRGKF